MERIIRLRIEKLPEGVYLATSDDVQGLIAQGETIAEVIETAREVAQMLKEIRAEYGFDEPAGLPIPDHFEYTLLLAA